MTQPDVLIIGAGLAGLVCAYECQQKGLRVHLVEATDRVGGRVQSDCIDGVVCDRGFQVFLPAYPTANSVVQPLEIDWKAYPKTAVIHGDKSQWFGAPFTSGHGEKLRLTPRDYWHFFCDVSAGLQNTNARYSRSTQDHIQRYSPAVSQQFLRPFFSSVFLDPDLQAPANLFQYYLALFARGGAAVPSHGMGMITQRLAEQLDPNSIQCNTPITQIVKAEGLWHAQTADSGLILAPIIVIATAHHQACTLLPELPSPTRALPVSTHYFLTDRVSDSLGPLTLFPKGTQCHHVAIPTHVAPDYTRDHQHLIMATTYGTDTVSADAILAELAQYADVKPWRWIHQVRLSHSLPDPCVVQQTDPTCVVVGDWTTMPSIEGACRSGRLAAQAIGVS